MPRDIDCSRCGDKLQDIVLEAQNIDLRKYRYTALALARMLFEIAAQDFLIEKKRFRELREKKINDMNSEKEKNGWPKLSKTETGKLRPSLEEITKFLMDNPEIWGPDIEPFMRRSLNSFVKHKKTLNSALHEPRQKIGEYRVVGIRDELMPILRQLIENPDIDEKKR